jgi:hypothetical protein
MSKKKLLEESTIRSFMKLANLQPLTDKFLKESEELEEAKAEEKDEEEEEDEEEEAEEKGEKEDEEEGKMQEELAPPADPRRPETGKQEEAKVEEGKESEDRPASKKEAPKGTSLAGKTPGKMDAAKNAAKDAKLAPMKQTHVHSDKPDSIETKDKSNAPKKNNSQFEMVSEAVEEMSDDMKEADMEGPEAPEAGAEMGSAGESGEHQDKMKELIRGMLNSLKDMGAEYGMSMEISDEGEAGAEEMAPPESPAPAGGEGEEDEAMMEQKLDEMVEKLTKRVAARLVKETKKKR